MTPFFSVMEMDLCVARRSLTFTVTTNPAVHHIEHWLMHCLPPLPRTRELERNVLLTIQNGLLEHRV